MDSIKNSLTALAELFNSRMNELQQDLHHQKSSSPVSISSLATDFNNFKTFIQSLYITLQRQVEFLALEIDRIEMKRRNKIIMFHGVPEQKSEDLIARVTSIIADHLDLPSFSTESVKGSYRFGRKSDKPKPIIVKFSELSTRDKVWFSKTKLKASGITQSEFLTKSRHAVFLEAREQFGVTKCWTRNGIIHVAAPDSTLHRIECMSDLSSIVSSSTSKSPVQTTNVQPKPAEKNVNQRVKRGKDFPSADITKY